MSDSRSAWPTTWEDYDIGLVERQARFDAPTPVMCQGSTRDILGEDGVSNKVATDLLSIVALIESAVRGKEEGKLQVD